MSSNDIHEVCYNLRVNQTEAEKILWECLRRHRHHGYKFRRQHPIGEFIVDFYCPATKLVIEVDGPIHDDEEHQIYDSFRDKKLESRGLRVLRFTNWEVQNELDGVLEEISKSLKSYIRKTSPPTPLHKNGEGR
jgi:very-short-patch-repair endonuclease